MYKIPCKSCGATDTQDDKARALVLTFHDVGCPVCGKLKSILNDIPSPRDPMEFYNKFSEYDRQFACECSATGNIDAGLGIIKRNLPTGWSEWEAWQAFWQLVQGCVIKCEIPTPKCPKCHRDIVIEDGIAGCPNCLLFF